MVGSGGAALLGSRLGTDVPPVITGLFPASVPPILAYVLLQHFIRRGLVIVAPGRSRAGDQP